jgi:hypothetical protein
MAIIIFLNMTLQGLANKAAGPNGWIKAEAGA